MRVSFFFLFVVIIIGIPGCQRLNPTAEGKEISVEKSITSQTKPASATAVIYTATILPTLEPALPANITPDATLTQIPTETPACVQLYYEEYAQVELISPGNDRVLIDIYDPGKLSRVTGEQDVLLTTHTHFDHINDSFLASFKGQQLFTRSGTLSLPGVEILGIPSAHNAGDRLKTEGGTNTIFLVVMHGLRIVHFGDIGQDVLTQEQLDLLGRVDVAITQFANSYSDMNIQNRKGFNLMDQVQPKWIIPTHLNLETATAGMNQWSVMYTDQPFVRFCLDELPDETQILLMGENASQFADRLGLVKYK